MHSAPFSLQGYMAAAAGHDSVKQTLQATQQNYSTRLITQICVNHITVNIIYQKNNLFNNLFALQR